MNFKNSSQTLISFAQEIIFLQSDMYRKPLWLPVLFSTEEGPPGENLFRIHCFFCDYLRYFKEKAKVPVC